MPSLQDAAPDMPISLEPYRAEDTYAEPAAELDALELKSEATRSFCWMLSSTFWGMDVEDHLREDDDGKSLVSYMTTVELNKMLRAAGEPLEPVLEKTERWESSGLSNYVLIHFHSNPHQHRTAA